MKLIDKLEAVRREVEEDLGHPPGSHFPFGEACFDFWLYDEGINRLYLFEDEHLFNENKDLKRWTSWEVVKLVEGKTITTFSLYLIDDIVLDNSKRLYK